MLILSLPNFRPDMNLYISVTWGGSIEFYADANSHRCRHAYTHEAITVTPLKWCEYIIRIITCMSDYRRGLT
jgi:hypothetical protein